MESIDWKLLKQSLKKWVENGESWINIVKTLIDNSANAEPVENTLINLYNGGNVPVRVYDVFLELKHFMLLFSASSEKFQQESPVEMELCKKIETSFFLINSCLGTIIIKLHEVNQIRAQQNKDIIHVAASAAKINVLDTSDEYLRKYTDISEKVYIDNIGKYLFDLLMCIFQYMQELTILRSIIDYKKNSYILDNFGTKSSSLYG
jgi:hypothetical protein